MNHVFFFILLAICHEPWLCDANNVLRKRKLLFHFIACLQRVSRLSDSQNTLTERDDFTSFNEVMCHFVIIHQPAILSSWSPSVGVSSHQDLQENQDTNSVDDAVNGDERNLAQMPPSYSGDEWCLDGENKIEGSLPRSCSCSCSAPCGTEMREGSEKRVGRPRVRHSDTRGGLETLSLIGTDELLFCQLHLEDRLELVGDS